MSQFGKSAFECFGSKQLLQKEREHNVLTMKGLLFTGILCMSYIREYTQVRLQKVLHINQNRLIVQKSSLLFLFNLIHFSYYHTYQP